jgi:hypothetical protein
VGNSGTDVDATEGTGATQVAGATEGAGAPSLDAIAASPARVDCLVGASPAESYGGAGNAAAGADAADDVGVTTLDAVSTLDTAFTAV